MTMPTNTCTLSDAEILHLPHTLAPGIPPGLDHPPLSPDTFTAPGPGAASHRKRPVLGTTQRQGGGP